MNCPCKLRISHQCSKNQFQTWFKKNWIYSDLLWSLYINGRVFSHHNQGSRLRYPHCDAICSYTRGFHVALFHRDQWSCLLLRRSFEEFADDILEVEKGVTGGEDWKCKGFLGYVVHVGNSAFMILYTCTKKMMYHIYVLYCLLCHRKNQNHINIACGKAYRVRRKLILPSLPKNQPANQHRKPTHTLRGAKSPRHEYPHLIHSTILRLDFDIISSCCWTWLRFFPQSLASTTPIKAQHAEPTGRTNTTTAWA